MKFFNFFLKYMEKLVGAGAGAEIFDKLEPRPEMHKNQPAPQHWRKQVKIPTSL
jgi:hypothetical protein